MNRQKIITYWTIFECVLTFPENMSADLCVIAEISLEGFDP